MSSETPPHRQPPVKPSRLSLLRLVAPTVPALLLKSASHFLSLTPQSAYWDLRTTLTIEFLRSYLGRDNSSATVEEIQGTTLKPLAVAANTWKVDVDLPGGSTDEQNALEGLVRKAIVDMADDEDVEAIIPRVGVGAATGEWVGSRTVKGEGEGEEERDGLSDGEKYERMMEEVEGGEESGVVLWLHGGAYWLCDPATHRPLARKVAKYLKGRVFLHRYRLAPQNPFPAALLDALVAYLYLLYPPPGAHHKPIPASRITIAGDSAGGNLTFSLLQLLLHLHRSGENEDGYEVIPSSGPKVAWQGALRELPLPAGIVGASPWVDVSRCFGERFTHKDGTMGSEESCRSFDYLPTPREERARKYKASPAWPADVQRSHFYAPDPLITHPLVSPLMAPHWTGAPPIHLTIGDELLRDASFFFAHRLASRGVPLQLLHFTSMPHVFQVTVPHVPVTRKSFEYLSEFLGGVFKGGDVRVGAFRVHPVTLEESAVGPEELKMGVEEGEVKGWMKREVELWVEKSEGVGATAKL